MSWSYSNPADEKPRHAQSGLFGSQDAPSPDETESVETIVRGALQVPPSIPASPGLIADIAAAIRANGGNMNRAAVLQVVNEVSLALHSIAQNPDAVIASSGHLSEQAIDDIRARVKESQEFVPNAMGGIMAGVSAAAGAVVAFGSSVKDKFMNLISPASRQQIAGLPAHEMQDAVDCAHKIAEKCEMQHKHHTPAILAELTPAAVGQAQQRGQGHGFDRT